MTSTEAPPPPRAQAARHHAECPLEDWLHFLGHRWNAVLLQQLASGTLRYTALAQRLPAISAKILAERLSGMVRCGLVIRNTGTGFPRHIDYSLSSRGWAVMHILDQFHPLGRPFDPVVTEEM